MSEAVGVSPHAQETSRSKLLQQQLVLLLHAHKCSERDRENIEAVSRNMEAPHEICALSQCRTMKGVLDHMTTCNQGWCGFAHCASSRQIIAHWKNCITVNCPVCKPLRNMHEGPHDSDDFSDFDAGIGASPQNSNGSGRQENAAGSMRAPDAVKEWQNSVPREMRNELVAKLVKAIYPEPDANPLNDHRLIAMISNARKVENEMFEMANGEEEYERLVSEKISKIEEEKATGVAVGTSAQSPVANGGSQNEDTENDDWEVVNM